MMRQSGPVLHRYLVSWEGHLRQRGAVYIAFFYEIDGWSCPKSLSARDRRMTAVIGAYRQYSTAVRSKILSSASSSQTVYRRKLVKSGQCVV